MGSPFPCIIIFAIGLILVLGALVVGFCLVVAGALLMRVERREPVETESGSDDAPPRKPRPLIGIVALIVGLAILLPVLYFIAIAVITAMNMR